MRRITLQITQVVQGTTIASRRNVKVRTVFYARPNLGLAEQVPVFRHVEASHLDQGLVCSQWFYYDAFNVIPRVLISATQAQNVDAVPHHKVPCREGTRKNGFLFERKAQTCIFWAFNSTRLLEAHWLLSPRIRLSSMRGSFSLKLFDEYSLKLKWRPYQKFTFSYKRIWTSSSLRRNNYLERKKVWLFQNYLKKGTTVVTYHTRNSE